MKAEGVPATRPGSAALLPTVPFIEKKVSPRPNWPTFQTARGKAMVYGPEICRRSASIVNRFAGPSIDPKYSDSDIADIVAAIRKVYPAAKRA